MTTPQKPKSKLAIIFNQDDLFDFAKMGGSVEAMFDEELRSGNKIVVIQKAENAPPELVMTLESMDEFNKWRENKVKREQYLKKLYGYEA